MDCQACQRRKRNLRGWLDGGTVPPGADWAFYAVLAVAVAAVAYIARGKIGARHGR